MTLNPYARIRALERQVATLASELNAARAKLAAGGRAAHAKQREKIMAMKVQLDRELGRA